MYEIKYLAMTAVKSSAVTFNFIVSTTSEFSSDCVEYKTYYGLVRSVEIIGYFMVINILIVCIKYSFVVPFNVTIAVC